MVRILRRTGVIVTVLCALLALASAASASGPTKEVFKDQGIIALPDIQCDGFTLTEETVSETVTVLTWSDENGDATRVLIKYIFFGIITNSASGNTYRDHASFTEDHDLVNGTFTSGGAAYHYVDSGRGLLYADGGHRVQVEEDGTVLFSGGPHDFADQGLQGLCDVLI